MRKILISIILSILISITTYFGISYDGVVIKIYGISFAIVSSGSMIPELTIGDIVIMKECNEYFVNDIITYKVDNEYLVTHRIIERDGKKFVTKGDNNNTKDIENVLEEDIEGKVIFKSRLLGVIYKYYFIIIVIILLLIILL